MKQTFGDEGSEEVFFVVPTLLTIGVFKAPQSSVSNESLPRTSAFVGATVSDFPAPPPALGIVGGGGGGPGGPGGAGGGVDVDDVDVSSISAYCSSFLLFNLLWRKNFLFNPQVIYFSRVIKTPTL